MGNMRSTNRTGPTTDYQQGDRAAVTVANIPIVDCSGSYQTGDPLGVRNYEELKLEDILVVDSAIVPPGGVSNIDIYPPVRTKARIQSLLWMAASIVGSTGTHQLRLGSTAPTSPLYMSGRGNGISALSFDAMEWGAGITLAVPNHTLAPQLVMGYLRATELLGLRFGYLNSTNLPSTGDRRLVVIMERVRIWPAV